MDTGDQVVKEWDPPATADQDVRLPGGVAFPDAPPKGVIKITGRRAHCDVWAQLPVAWDQVLFRFCARSGPLRVVLDVRRAVDMERPLVTGIATALVRSGLLFSVRSHPCDEFYVEAWSLEAALAKAKFRMEAWGQEGDRAGAGRDQRPATDLWAHAHQQWRFPSAAAPAALPVGGAGTTIAAVNPLGGRSFVRAIVIASNDAVPQLVSLRRQPGNIVEREYRTEAGGGTTVDDMTDPLRSDPGETWDVLLGAVSGGSEVRLSATGHYE